uniref:Uncharacterized protein n=1 Tax=Palpitomonas bilix TaxID=652834 RepID=A0A7S3D4J0_9EUKA|mmetsp:Transcript_21598/g.56091  ORF Transcript_21598/g.56091 Transcript_21598/m.56091 type:complete len:246 (+) Transcript_21598:362-1099(+)
MKKSKKRASSSSDESEDDWEPPKRHVLGGATVGPSMPASMGGEEEEHETGYLSFLPKPKHSLNLNVSASETGSDEAGKKRSLSASTTAGGVDSVTLEEGDGEEGENRKKKAKTAADMVNLADPAMMEAYNAAAAAAGGSGQGFTRANEVSNLHGILPEDELRRAAQQGVAIKDVSADSVREGVFTPANGLAMLEGNMAARVSRSEKSKHQITELVAQAKSREMMIASGALEGQKTRREAQAKYAW